MNREELLKIGKPILFNTPMTQAILDGRKTCTRRAIKIDLGLADTDKNDSSYLKIPDEYGDYHDAKDLCRYRAGDILYVRETWQDGSFLEDDKGNIADYIYKADDDGSDNSYSAWGIKWKPSIHMPKTAARIFLKVTDVRVERLQDICNNNYEIVDENGSRYPINFYKEGSFSCGEFAELWDSTIKKQDLDRYGWEANPFVWIVEFERVEVK